MLALDASSSFPLATVFLSFRRHRRCDRVSAKGPSMFLLLLLLRRLDASVQSYLADRHKVLVGKRTVILPRIVYWYSADFSNSNSAEEPSGAQGLSSSSSSPLSCLLHVKRYLTG